MIGVIGRLPARGPSPVRRGVRTRQQRRGAAGRRAARRAGPVTPVDDLRPFRQVAADDGRRRAVGDAGLDGDPVSMPSASTHTAGASPSADADRAPARAWRARLPGSGPVGPPGARRSRSRATRRRSRCPPSRDLLPSCSNTSAVGRKRSAAFGTRSTSSARAISIVTFAVMPGLSFSSGFGTSMTVV